MVVLILSTFASGVIATAVMLAVAYLPLAWGGRPYDLVRALGSSLTGRDDGRATYLGATAFTLGGILFALLYGMLVRALLASGDAVPSFARITGLPAEIELFYPFLGAILGFAHGGVVILLLTIVVAEHHPLARFRDGFGFVVPVLLGHVAFGATVTFFQHQLLQLLGG